MKAVTFLERISRWRSRSFMVADASGLSLVQQPTWPWDHDRQMSTRLFEMEANAQCHFS